jgi:hypothetical protein
MLRIPRLSIRCPLLCQDALVPGCQDGFLIHQLAVVIFAEPDIDTRPSGGIGIIREATEYSGLRARFRLAYPRRRLFHSFTLSLFPTRAADIDPNCTPLKRTRMANACAGNVQESRFFASTSQPATFSARFQTIPGYGERMYLRSSSASDWTSSRRCLTTSPILMIP